MDDSETVRRIVELERRFLRPARVELDRTLADLTSGPELWQRAVTDARIRASWIDDPRRRFRTRAGLGPVPSDLQAARLYVGDPDGMLAAEAHARSLLGPLEPFGLEVRPDTIVWRISGAAVERPEAGEPPLGLLRAPIRRACELVQRISSGLDSAHPHLRFRLAEQVARRSVEFECAGDQVVSGRQFAELENPFLPWLRLWSTGYWLWSLTERTIELAAPFPVPSGPRASKRGRPNIKRRSSPAPLWSQTLSSLRLAYVRGDVGGIARLHRRLASVEDPSRAPLLHFAVYGGPAALDVLAGECALDLDARDDEDRTALMIAAAQLHAGPLGASEEEVAAPRGSAEGRAACAWLLARGADIQARDLRGWTALHWAAFAGRVDTVALLTRHQVELDAADQFGQTPMMLALSNEGSLAGRIEIIEVLLAAGADADARDDQGWTILHYLAIAPDVSGAARIARIVRGRAMPSRDRAGRSPRDLAGADAETLGFDHTVALGPGNWPAPDRAPKLEERLNAPDQSGVERRHTLAVWADWLLAHGDPRGEFLALELSGRPRTRSRAAHEREISRARTRLGARFERGLRFADPDMAIGRSDIRVEREHGMIVRAWIPMTGAAELDALRVVGLLAHEPLLVDVRLEFTGQKAGPLKISPADQVLADWLQALQARLPNLRVHIL